MRVVWPPKRPILRHQLREQEIWNPSPSQENTAHRSTPRLLSSTPRNSTADCRNPSREYGNFNVEGTKYFLDQTDSKKGKRWANGFACNTFATTAISAPWWYRSPQHISLDSELRVLSNFVACDWYKYGLHVGDSYLWLTYVVGVTTMCGAWGGGTERVGGTLVHVLFCWEGDEFQIFYICIYHD
jgi:hypothetical protein